METLETIYVEIDSKSPPKYFAIKARRTNDNFFQIVSELPKNHIGAFKYGDIVRCLWRYFGQGFSGGIVALMQADTKLPIFSVGDNVMVSEHAGWQSNFVGKVVSAPEDGVSMLGPEKLYIIEFAEPQKDRCEDYQYVKAQISNAYLESV